VEVKCCGGKTKMVAAYRCEQHPEPKTDRDCARCKEYQSQSASWRTETQRTSRGQEVTTCASWESLWQIHRGQTALILACGPSVLLPGEDPSPDTVDPRPLVKAKGQPIRQLADRDAEEAQRTTCLSEQESLGSAGLADVVISTNWAWKWYADIIDYQVSYDPTPCYGWRPPGIKLLTAARKRETMAVLEKAGVYCFFPACDYGEIAQGKPLPCSRNSGYAALAFAAYAGCGRILVLGMDFGPREDSSAEAPQERRRMHFYHEGKHDVERRVRSFGRQQSRVQGDLTKLLAAVRATGATVENLSPRSELSWD